MPTSTIVILALGVCAAGLMWRLGRWVRGAFHPEEGDLTPYGTAVGWNPAGRKRPDRRGVVALPGVLLWDVLLQRPLWRQDRIRWAAHMATCYGFLLLIGLHALDDWTAPVLFASCCWSR